MRLEGFVEKGWGSEFIFATNDKYCGKLLKFNTGAKFSMHFHAHKDETWYVLNGKFEVKYIQNERFLVGLALTCFNRSHTANYSLHFTMTLFLYQAKGSGLCYRHLELYCIFSKCFF